MLCRLKRYVFLFSIHLIVLLLRKILIIIIVRVKQSLASESYWTRKSRSGTFFRENIINVFLFVSRILNV